MSENGLTRFAVHSTDLRYGRVVAAIAEEVAGKGRTRSVDADPGRLDPESAARRYLARMIDSPSVPALPAPVPDQVGPEYRTIGTQTVPLTGTTVVKFAQYLGRTPVYGSLVTLELDLNNSLLAVSSALGDPADVDSVATLSPAQARSVIRDHQGDPSSSTDVPRLYFYFDAEVASPAWRLVYIQRDVLREPSDDGDRYEDAGLVAAPELLDYVVDAHTGDLVATLPRTQTLFYLAVSQYLSRTSGFSDSRRGVELAARTLFRDGTADDRERKLAAIARAFEDVGIAATV